MRADEAQAQSELQQLWEQHKKSKKELDKLIEELKNERPNASTSKTT